MSNRAPRTAAQIEAARRTAAQNREVLLDWTKDPCKRCGKYPLHVSNESGYCRECSRRHVNHDTPPNRQGLGQHRDRWPDGRFRAFTRSAAA